MTGKAANNNSLSGVICWSTERQVWVARVYDSLKQTDRNAVAVRGLFGPDWLARQMDGAVKRRDVSFDAHQLLVRGMRGDLGDRLLSVLQAAQLEHDGRPITWTLRRS